MKIPRKRENAPKPSTQIRYILFLSVINFECFEPFWYSQRVLVRLYSYLIEDLQNRVVY